MARALSHCSPLIFSQGRMPTRNGSQEPPVGLRQFQQSRDRSVRGTDTTQPPHKSLNQARTARSRFATTTVTEYVYFARAGTNVRVTAMQPSPSTKPAA